MGIDKIGKNTGVQGTTGAEATEGSAPVERSFADVHAEKTARTESTAGAASASPLDRLKSGELDVNGYIEARLDQATQGLKGLSSSQLGSVRLVLREQMMTDPGLSELVRQATGHAPKLPED